MFSFACLYRFRVAYTHPPLNFTLIANLFAPEGGGGGGSRGYTKRHVGKLKEAGVGGGEKNDHNHHHREG